MKNIIVAAIGTDIGKTVVSAILLKAFGGEYWKPVQCGNLDQCDTSTVKRLVDDPALVCYPEAYRLKHPLSPHHAAALEGIQIDPARVRLPKSEKHLIIEGVGGLLVPWTDMHLQLDMMCRWEAGWVLVCKHYLGSINHSLLSLEGLKSRKIRVTGIIFNGPEAPFSERVILQHGKPLFWARLNQESEINPQRIDQYAKGWKKHGKHFS